MTAHAAPHALLVVDWGTQGAALLSVPTREYLQSSGWVDAAPPTWDTATSPLAERAGAFASVRTGSGFWADGRPRSGVTLAGSDASQWTGSALTPATPATPTRAEERAGAGEEHADGDADGDADSRRTSVETERGGGSSSRGGGGGGGNGVAVGAGGGDGGDADGDAQVDAVGAHEAFVAGMVFALSQRILPGRPYVREGDVRAPQPPHAPGFGVPHAGAAGGADVLPGGSAGGSGKWRLEECLRCVSLHPIASHELALTLRPFFFGAGLQRSWRGARAGGRGLRI
jgi:hypothetical protein